MKVNGMFQRSQAVSCKELSASSPLFLNTGNLEPHGLSSHPDSITQYPVWTWRSITTTSCLNFHSDKTAIRGSLWGFNKIMPCQAYWHDKHSVNMSCASATERIWHQSGGTRSVPLSNLNFTEGAAACHWGLWSRGVIQSSLASCKLIWGQPWVGCTKICDYLQSVCIDEGKGWN